MSDEELEAHVSRVESGSLTDESDVTVARRIEAIDRAARAIHAEFARHGAVVERRDGTGDRSLADRLADVERRLAEVERVLCEGPTVPADEE